MSKQSRRLPRKLAAAAAVLAIAGCGGGGAGEPDSNAGSFEAYAHALQVQGGTPDAVTPLTPAHKAEIARRSREWAVRVLDTGDISYMINSFALPPLHFARLHTVEAAANGDTLAAVRQEGGPSDDAAVRTGLMTGLQRRIDALAQHTFEPAFLAEASASGRPGTWRSLTLAPLTAAQLAADSNTRMSVSDDIGNTWAWPAVVGFRGVHDSPGGRVAVDMLRVQGPMFRHSGTGYEATGLALADGSWLIKLEAAQHTSAWAGAALLAALADVVPGIVAQPASAAAVGTMTLPVMGLAGDASHGMDSFTGVGAATGATSADLRRLDGGGTYLQSERGTAGLSLSTRGLELNGQQRFSFVFSPLNPYGPSYGTGAVAVTLPGVVGGPVPACPTQDAGLRPFHLFVMRPNGALLALARLVQFSGSRCE